MTKFFTTERDGKWVVTNGDIEFAVLHSEDAARTAAQALNYRPDVNPFAHYKNGRWSDRKVES